MKPKESVHNILKGSRQPTKSKPRIANPSPRQPGKGGRVMWAIPECVLPESRTMLLHKTVGPTFSHPVLVLDLSPEARKDRERLDWLIVNEGIIKQSWAHGATCDLYYVYDGADNRLSDGFIDPRAGLVGYSGH